MAEKPNKERRKPFYQSRKLLIAVGVALFLTLSGIMLAFWPGAVAAIGAAIGAVGMMVAVISEAWDKLDDKIKALFKRLVSTEKKVDDNSERATMLEASNEALSRQFADVARIAHNLTDDLQQERVENKAIIAELKEQLKAQQKEITELKESHRKEIAALHEQIDRMGKDSTIDKEEIIILRQRVSELETKVAVLSVENEHLREENHELKGHINHKSTSPAAGLMPGDTVTLERVENEGR